MGLDEPGCHVHQLVGSVEYYEAPLLEDDTFVLVYDLCKPLNYTCYQMREDRVVDVCTQNLKINWFW